MLSVYLLAGSGFTCRTRPLFVGGLSTRLLSSEISNMGFMLLASLVDSIIFQISVFFVLGVRSECFCLWV